ncbi:uncharacterized protein LOC128259405 [Drosophila gunungcola]|uniref:Secreted protein n=1 Tax=Drosophila gunungcola TaxID=103775 RepID=A0A9P9YLK2_9MUSC|nr:uncharacterized protein LOC128259405 [Drosophila gunungcola]XP_052847719.1 uncharacterized protein LOC128259405 [Drosophila gunungcola]KAI8039198.1 hypothetical protein M5D96_007915 [Drosophila gunungcola]
MVKTSACLGNSIWLGLLVFLVLGIFTYTEAAPYQELEPRKGHVPVYIRHGDEPLSEIHPGLAEAFKEGQSKSLVTDAPQAETTNPPATSDSPVPSSSTVSDIASFEAIKAMLSE